MFDTQGLTEFLSQSETSGDIDIVTHLSPLGTITKMSYSQEDGCYTVAVDGHERIRSKSLHIALGFLNSLG